MESRFVCGVDPGAGGGIGLIGVAENFYLVHPLPDTEMDCVDLFQEYASRIDILALEKVHSFPGQGVASTFTFGKNYGFLRGVIMTLKIPLVDVTPSVWMKALGCQTKGDKNVTKSMAQQLFPNVKITHKTADAILIAHWLRKYGIHA